MGRTALGWAKHAVQVAANSCGLSITKFPLPSSLEHHLASLFRILEIDCIVDIGAHKGEYRRLVRELGYQGLILSFEPVKESFAALKADAASDSQWLGVNVALGDQDGEAVMNLYSSSVFNSLHNLSDAAKSSYDVATEAPRQEQVTLRRLDTVLGEHLPDLAKRRIFLKMDTQGHDAVVIQGAERILPQVAGLQSELAAVRIYDNMPRLDDSIRLYMTYGFVPTFFGPVNTFESTLVSPEWDVVLRRPPERVS